MKDEYGIIRAKDIRHRKFPAIDLLPINPTLTVAHPAFGPNYLSKNEIEMKKFYSHPETGEKITFRKPRTHESISAAAYKFGELAKPQIFDPRWLQLGPIVKT